MYIKIYQCNLERDCNELAFCNYEFAMAHGGINPANYDMVYSGNVNCKTADDVFAMFNISRPEDYMGRSLSVSDILEITKDGESEFLFVDSIGFQKVEFVSELAQEKYHETMDVVILEPGKKARIGKVGKSLEDMQRFVSGYIEAVYPFKEEAAIICNEEGKIEGLPLNRALRLNMGGETDSDEIYDVISGKAFICGLGDSSFESLSKENLQHFKELFLQPEIFVQEGNTIQSVKVEENTYSHVMKHR